jgi:hypothetical protein
MKFLLSCLSGFFALVLSFSAAAAEAVYTSLTGAVTFVNVIAALLAIGAVLAALYVARKGVYLVLGMLKTKG